VRDYAECVTGATSTPRSASRRCSSSSRRRGLDKLDRDILQAICIKFDGGPVGLDTLAVALGEEADTIMDVYEPYLIMRGFLKRTPRGRVLTKSGFRHCGVEPPASSVGETLFD
jgi:Holliday junction DNA helicase RuvB